MTSDKKTPPRRDGARGTNRKSSGSGQSSHAGQKRQQSPGADSTDETIDAMKTIAAAMWEAAQWLGDEKHRDSLQQGIDGAKEGLRLAGDAMKGVADAAKRVRGAIGSRHSKGREKRDRPEPPPGTSLDDLCGMARLVGRQTRLQDEADDLAFPQQYMSPEKVALRGRVLLQGVLTHLPTDHQNAVIDAFTLGYQAEVEDAAQGEDAAATQRTNG